MQFLEFVRATEDQDIKSLVNKLRNEDLDVRIDTVINLGNIGKDALPALIASLQDQHWKVRLLAAEAISKMGPSAKDAISELQERAEKDSSEIVRHSAELAIKLIEPEF